MSSRDRNDPPKAPQPAAPAETPRSGRVQFDERGQAVWEWAVKTGLFDRNASTSRIKALTEGPVKLEIAETPKAPPKATAPQKTPAAPPPRAKPLAGESSGGDPYSRGPARKPETVTFNPYDSGPRRKS